MIIRLFQLIFLVLMASCSGYRVVNYSNPLSQYEIKKVSIPAFINRSSLAMMTGSLTREFTLMLSQFKGLEVSVGDDPQADAVLIGVLHSEDSLRLAMRATGPRLAGTFNSQIGKVRPDFNLPGTTNIRAAVQLILIKRPTPEEIQILTSSLGREIQSTNNVVLNEFIPLNGAFTREVFSGEVNGVQSTGAQKRVMDSMAQNAARFFRENVLYAF